MARPRKKIDEELLKELAMIQCTQEEMASILKCSVDTLQRRYSDVLAEARENGKMSLKRAMYRKAVVEGNPTMQIWLSKNWLRYSDKTEITPGEGAKSLVDIIKASVGKKMEPEKSEGK